MNTAIHLHLDGDLPVVHLHGAQMPRPCAAVGLDHGALTVFATTPADLLLLAEAFTDAARQLSQELDKAAAREMNAERVPA